MKLRYSTGCGKEEAKILLGGGCTDSVEGSLYGKDTSMESLSPNVPKESSSLIRYISSVGGGSEDFSRSGIERLSEISDLLGDFSLSKRLSAVDDLTKLGEEKLNIISSVERNLTDGDSDSDP